MFLSGVNRLIDNIRFDIQDAIDAVALNPQPLPPEPPDPYPWSGADLLERYALNPQPLPPEPPELQFRAALFEDVLLNNEPLPPNPEPKFRTAIFDDVFLNPQPLPPEEFEDPQPPSPGDPVELVDVASYFASMFRLRY